MPKRKCEACDGKGWVAVVAHGSDFYNDDDLHIERCDACDKFESDGCAETAYLKAVVSARTEKLPDHLPLTLYNGYHDFYLNKKRGQRASTRKRKA